MAPQTETQDAKAGNASDGSNPAESPEDTKGSSKGDADRDFSQTPVPQAGSNLPGYPSHLTPGTGGYYQQGYQHVHATPEPPSPAGGPVGVYDVGSFFQQHGAFANTRNNPFPNTPLSPPRGGNMGIPPASPLFPRVANNGQGVPMIPGANGLEQQNRGAPPSPQLPYISSMYQQSYPLMNHGNLHSGTSPEEVTGWGERYVHALHLMPSLVNWIYFSCTHDSSTLLLNIIQKPAAATTQHLPKLAPDECIRNASDPGYIWRPSLLVRGINASTFRCSWAARSRQPRLFALRRKPG
jgi:hypothetical protein